MEKLTFTVCIVLSLLGGSPVRADTNTGLIATFPLAGNGNDTTGTNPCVVYRATGTVDRFGNPNGALSFNGASSFLAVRRNFDFKRLDGITFSVWVRPGNGGVIYHQGTGGEIWMSVGRNVADFSVRLSDGSWCGSEVPIRVPTDRFMHLCGVFKKGAKVELWADGVLVNRTNAPNLLLSEPVFGYYQANVGVYQDAVHGFLPWSYYQGAMDDLRIYSRALTEADIQELQDVPSRSDTTSGLVASYAFDGNANDSTGTNHGAAYRTTWVADRFGNPSGACRLNGTSSYIGLDQNFDFNSFGDLTFSAWVKPEEGGMIYHQGTGGEIWMSIGNNAAEFSVHLDDGLWYGGEVPVSIPANRYVNLCGVVQRGVKVQLWVDGVLVSSTNAPNNPFYEPAFGFFQGNVGVYQDAMHGFLPWSFYQGSIDDLRIYNRALSPADILGLQDAPPFVTVTQATQSATDGFRFVVGGREGTACSVQATTDPGSGNWSSVAIDTIPFTFVDADAKEAVQRFYRVVPLR